MFPILKCGQFNIRGIQSHECYRYKLKEIRKLLKKHNLDVLLLQEVLVTARETVHKDNNGECFYICPKTTKRIPIRLKNADFNEYTLFITSTEVAILYRSTLIVNELTNFLPIRNLRNENIATCGISITTKKHPLSIYCYYRPPKKGQSKQIFQHKYDGHYIVLGGDLNLHHEMWEVTTTRNNQ